MFRRSWSTSWSKFAIVCVALAILGGCQKSDQARAIQVPTIRTPAEADDYILKAEKLSKEPLEKSGRDELLTSAEQDNVKEALAYFQGIIAYDPSRYQPYFAAGKMAYALGEYEQALTYLQQAIKLAPPPSKNPPVELVTLIAEAHYVSSRALFFLHRYDEAAEGARLASMLVTSSADYLVAEASARLEMKQDDKAKDLVVRALAIDPNHRIAKQLAKLLKL